MSAMRPVTHRLVGNPAEVANVLRAAQARGHLVRYGRPEPLSRHRVAITVTMLEPVPTVAPKPRRRWLRHVGIAVGALTASAVLSGLLWVLAQVVQWVQANWVPLACLAGLALLGFGVSQESRR
jgi:hypothetical protein